MAYTAIQKATASRYARRWQMTDVTLFYKSRSMGGNRKKQVLYVSMFDEDDIEYHIRYDRKIVRMKSPPSRREIANWKDGFIREAELIHGDKYDYSKIPEDRPLVHEKIEIICKKHGSFYQTAKAHINIVRGCPKCARDRRKMYEDSTCEINKLKNKDDE